MAKSAGTGVSQLGGAPDQTSGTPFQDSEWWMVARVPDSLSPLII